LPLIGRTVEKAFLGYAVRDFQELGTTCITGEYISTAKNGMAAHLYGEFGFTQTDTGENRTKRPLDLNRRSLAVPE
jgi:predicted enzyme involved in methoxymalonyl-ACP biosynthesis